MTDRHSNPPGNPTICRSADAVSPRALSDLFAGGLIKSTIDSEQAGFTPILNDYGISGPYSATDWNGPSATTVTIDIKSYPTAGGAEEKAGGTWRAYDVGVAKIDLTTGKPVSHSFARAACSARHL